MALVVLILVNAVIPAATIVATGLMIGSLSATVHAGLASPAGHRTLATLGAWAALMMLGEMEPRLLTAAAAFLAASRVESRVQERVIAALNRPWSIAHLESPRTADLLSQVSGLGVGAVGPGLAVSGLVTSRVPMILRSVVSGALLLAYSWPMALLLAAVQVFFVRQIRRGWVADAQNLLGKTDAVRRADYYRDLALGAGTAKEMRVLGLAGWLDARLRRESMTGLLQQWKAHRWNALGGVLGATAAGLAGLVVYGLLARDAASGVITIGALVIYLRAAQAIGGWGLSNADYQIEYGCAALPALRELEAMTTAGAEVAPKALAADAPAREIRFDDVSFAYADGAPVLRDLSLAIPAGSSLAIVGLNGAGKTTLVKLLARLYDPTGGAITVDGVDLREVDPAAWRARIAAIFQDFLRFGLSARDNVGFGGPALLDDDAALARAAGKAGVLDRIRALPKGWETPLMRQFTDGADLSGGEWQRVALAQGVLRGGGRRAAADPRRAHRRPRRARRGRALRPLPRPDARPHHHPDLAPLLHRAPRRPDLRDRGRLRAGAGLARRADGAGRPLRRALHAAVAALRRGGGGRMKELDAVRGAVRSAATVAKLGFGAAPARVSLALVAELLGAGFGLASAYAIKFVVQAAVAHDPAGAVWAAAALALLAAAGAVAYLVYASLLPKMIEVVTLQLDHELIRLANRIPTLEHHDRPAFADKLELVRQGRQSIAGSVQIIGLSARTVGHVGRRRRDHGQHRPALPDPAAVRHPARLRRDARSEADQELAGRPSPSRCVCAPTSTATSPRPQPARRSGCSASSRP